MDFLSKQNESTTYTETRPTKLKQTSSIDVELLAETPDYVSQQDAMNEDRTEEEKMTPIVQNKHKKREHSVENDPSFVDMMHKVATSQQSIQELCIGIKELHSSSRDVTSSKSVDNLLESVSKSQEQVTYSCSVLCIHC